MKKNLIKKIKISLAGAVLGVLPFMACPANASDTLPKFHQLTVLKHLDENAYQNFRFINKKAGDVMDLQHEKLNINERNILYKELLYSCTDLEIVNFLKKQYLSSAKIQEGRGTVYLNERACDLLAGGKVEINGQVISLEEYIKGDTRIIFCSNFHRPHSFGHSFTYDDIYGDKYLYGGADFKNKITKFFVDDWGLLGKKLDFKAFPALREVRLNRTCINPIPFIKELNDLPAMEKCVIQFSPAYLNKIELEELEKIKKDKNFIFSFPGFRKEDSHNIKLLQEKDIKTAYKCLTLNPKREDNCPDLDNMVYLKPIESLCECIKYYGDKGGFFKKIGSEFFEKYVISQIDVTVKGMYELNNFWEFAKNESIKNLDITVRVDPFASNFENLEKIFSEKDVKNLKERGVTFKILVLKKNFKELKEKGIEIEFEK